MPDPMFKETADRIVSFARQRDIQKILAKIRTNENSYVIRCPNCDEYTCHTDDEDEVCSACLYHSER